MGVVDIPDAEGGTLYTALRQAGLDASMVCGLGSCGIEVARRDVNAALKILGKHLQEHGCEMRFLTPIASPATYSPGITARRRPRVITHPDGHDEYRYVVYRRLVVRGAVRARVFTECVFRSCDFRGADFTGCTFSACDLRDARLDGANLKDAVYTLGTLWPAGFDPQRAGARLVE